MITKSFAAAETKVIGNPDLGLVECVFSVTGSVDRQGDRIVPGAFNKALAAKQSVPVVYGHSWDRIDAVLGRTKSMRELMPGSWELPESVRSQGFGGVKAAIQFEMGVPSGQAAFTHLKHGNLTQYSFAFEVDDDVQTYENGSNVREIKSIREIHEVTVALVGANEHTATLVAKSATGDAWTDVSRHVAGLVADRRPPAKSEVPNEAPPTAGSRDYMQSVHARKAAEFERKQRYYAELRRKMGLDPGPDGRFRPSS